MCYYIQKMCYNDIIRMKCEFIKDDHNTIWFTYASDIYMRLNK